jgi:hypothetical protein
MDNIYKVKTQLEESARFANSSVMGHDRLAVILMDNLIEIQLGRQMHFRFRTEFLNDYKTLKYPLDKRQEILFNHDKLLKVCYEEGIITSHERAMLGFCHDVRNRLYHKGDEDSLLIEIALGILYEIILHRQPEWKGGSDIIRLPFNTDGTPIDMEHPFTKQRKKELGPIAYETGSKEDWLDFVKYNFKSLDKSQPPSKLLSEFLTVGIKRLRWALDYAINCNEKKTNFDELLLNYSFKIKHRDELQRVREMRDKRAAKAMHDKLFKTYKQTYRPLYEKRIDAFKAIANKLSSLSSGEALEKYISIRTDFFLMHDSFVLAAQETQNEMHAKVDKHLKKIKQKTRSKK